MAPPVQPKSFVARHVLAIPRSGIREFFDVVQNQSDVISLGVGEPDFVTPWHIREARFTPWTRQDKAIRPIWDY
jgi:aminotransferase